MKRSNLIAEKYKLRRIGKVSQITLGGGIYEPDGWRDGTMDCTDPIGEHCHFVPSEEEIIERLALENSSAGLRSNKIRARGRSLD